MSVQSTASRPAGRSVAAAVTGLVVTLVAFVLVMVSFLLAPLALFGVAVVCYLVLRPRSKRPTSGVTDRPAGGLGHGFGSGVR